MIDDLKNKLVEFGKDPGRLLGLIYPYILLIVLAVGFLYINNLNRIAKQDIPVTLPDTTKQQELKIVEPRTIPAVNITELSKPSAGLLNKGKEIYNNVCSSCHGAEGEGNGPASAGLNPPPRNFTGSTGWKNSPKLNGIYITLEEGIPGTAMVSYEYMIPEEKIALAHYIRETFVPNPPADSEGELAALDQTYNLSQGKEIPAQIPVKDAIEIFLKENEEKVQKITAILGSMSETNSEGGKIFSSIADKKFNAISSLSADSLWMGKPEKFREIIISDINSNGFNNRVFRLSRSEWDILYNYMSSYF